MNSSFVHGLLTVGMVTPALSKADLRPRKHSEVS